MRILLTGSKGQLGQSVRRRLPEDWELIAADSQTLDITDREAVANMVKNFQPDAIINTAACIGAEKAREKTDKIFAVNAGGARNLAQAAAEAGAKFIHLSTDYVFNGLSRQPYAETDAPDPRCVYAQSKLSGELLALAAYPDSLIIRTSWVYGEYGRNFVKTLLSGGQKEIRLADDNAACPTYSGDLADTIIGLLRLPTFPRGLLHYCGSQAFSQYGFGLAVLKAAAEHDPAFAAPRIVPVQQAQEDKNGKRPLYSVLDCSRARSLGFAQGDWQKTITQLLDHLAP
ncbi:MAG: dTDP-4-dehydrorhamnose reductase [Neisseria sp.]|nr:dTDP-4-dehydrorhamnose reductase [Neisseria sp.]